MLINIKSTRDLNYNYFQLNTKWCDINFCEVGNGPVILIWPSVFCDSNSNIFLVESLKDKFKFIMVDPPGFGSDLVAKSFTMEDCAEIINQILIFREIKMPITLIGTSWGGFVVSFFAYKYPFKVNKLVLTNTYFYTPDKKNTLLFQFKNAVSYLLLKYMKKEFIIKSITKDFFSSHILTNNYSQQLYQLWKSRMNIFNKNEIASATFNILKNIESVHSKIQKLNFKILIIGGALDKNYDFKKNKTLLNNYYKQNHLNINFDLVILEHSKHNSFIDSPEETLSEISNFII